jgi:uncharacterized protein
MTKTEAINIIRSYFVAFPIQRVCLFGSFARGESKADSDIDILVTFKEPVDLFTFVRMTRELSEKLGRKVDLVTEKSLHPAFRSSVAKDLQIIAEA